MTTRVTEFWRDEEGQDMVEYALLMSFIALTVLSLVTGLQTSLVSLLSSVSQKFGNAVAQLSAS